MTATVKLAKGKGDRGRSPFLDLDGKLLVRLTGFIIDDEVMAAFVWSTERDSMVHVWKGKGHAEVDAAIRWVERECRDRPDYARGEGTKVLALLRKVKADWNREHGGPARFLAKRRAD